MMITMVLCWLLAAESRLRCSIHQFTISAIKTEFSLLIYVLGLCMSIEVLYRWRAAFSLCTALVRLKILHFRLF